MTTITPEPVEVPTQRRRRLPLVLAALALVVAVAAAVTAFVVADDDDRPGFGMGMGMTPAAAMQQGCVQWLDDTGGGARPGADWCTGMAAWMGGRMGDAATMGRMMADPAQMRAACDAWTTSESATGAGAGGAGRWCDEMVTWMGTHDGPWRDGDGATMRR